MKKLFLGLVVVLAGCVASPKISDTYPAVENNAWLQAVMKYRQELKQDPRNPELRAHLRRVENDAAEYFLKEGHAQLGKGESAVAIQLYQQGLLAMPGHERLLEALGRSATLKNADELYQEAVSKRELDRIEDAIALLQRALLINPKHEQAGELLGVLRQQRGGGQGHGLQLSSSKPITLSFKDTELKTAFDFIAKAFGINVIFDEQVKNEPVTLYAKNVTFTQALHLMLKTSSLFFKRIGSNTILVAQDTGDKRGQYEDYLIRTFVLNTMIAKDMANLLKSSLGLKNVVVNEGLNSLLIRDTESMLELAEKLILANDRRRSEILLDVEIMEVNRTKTELLGLNFGEKLEAKYPAYEVNTNFRDTVLRAGTVTIPTVTLNYLKKDVDANILANPKIRTIDNKAAKIHIGDRVPLRSATIVDATGQTRTTFEYRDVGIKLDVVPDIHQDNSVTVEIKLEISSIGNNVGTENEPVFSIGTRNVETSMLLKDSETAIIGGLIRDIGNSGKTRLPLLGEIYGIGRLFTNSSGEATRTDVLLTITPRVIRTAELPHHTVQKIYSGTEKQYATGPLFEYLANSDIRIGEDSGSKQKVSATPDAGRLFTDSLNLVERETDGASQAMLRFTQPQYTVKRDEEIEIEITADNLSIFDSLPVNIIYNADLLEFVRVEQASVNVGQFMAEEDQPGLLKIHLLDHQQEVNEAVKLARVTLRAKEPGVSYLAYQSAAMKMKNGTTQALQSSASRVVIR